MKRMLCSLLSIFLLTAAAEEIENVDAPLIHSEDLPLAVDISPVIRFETDETAVSRRDNHTLICSRCGTREALEDLGMDELKIEGILTAIYGDDVE